MGRTLVLTLALTAAALVAGCATPTPQQAQSAESARLEAERLLNDFALAVQAKDASSLQRLLSPAVTPSQFLPMAMKLQAASWLKSYSGYSIDAGAELERVSWRRWDSGQVELSVPVTNVEGGTFTNDFVLAKGREGWYIRDFTVDQPQAGDPVEPPAGVVMQIRPVLQDIMKALQEGRIAEVWYSMSEDPAARYRAPVLSFWQRLSMSDEAGALSIFDDLNRVKALQIAGWPSPSQPPEFTWLGPGAVTAVYELPYAWSSEAQTLRVELTFVNRDGVWTFYTIRFIGAAMPYSE